MMATRSPGFSTSTRSNQPFEAVLGVQANPRVEGGCDPHLVALDRGAHVLLGEVNEIRSGRTRGAGTAGGITVEDVWRVQSIEATTTGGVIV